MIHVRRGQAFRSRAASALLLNELYIGGVWSLIDHLLREGAHVFVCAGAVRDVIAAIEGLPTRVRARDFDLAVYGMSDSQLGYALAHYGARRNRYGGFHVDGGAFPSVDLWLAHRTCGVVFHNAQPTIVNILRSFVLDCNAVAFSVRDEVFVDLGAVSALRRRSVGIIGDALMHDEAIFASKALALSNRFGLSLLHDVRRLVESGLTTNALLHEAVKSNLSTAWARSWIQSLLIRRIRLR